MHSLSQRRPLRQHQQLLRRSLLRPLRLKKSNPLTQK